MKRLSLLAAMLALGAVIAAVVLFASPYAPVIGPAGDIEALWAIEDTRTESWDPLVTVLENNGVPLAYDAQQNTFFCTLGMENGETWPQIHLTAPGAEGVSLIFSDDYTYDWCSEAIREAYSYEVMAYTETEYAYFYIVFTGLPQMCITTTQEVTVEDSACHVVMSAYGEEPLDSTARIHLRGASTLLAAKKNYKVEFTRERNGKGKKVEKYVPGFGMANDLAVLPCGHDDLKMRDRLNWALYGEQAAEDESFGTRRTQYVEVFIDGAYSGLYVMIEPMDVVEELRLSGEDRLLTDSVYRTAALNFSHGRDYIDHPRRANAGYELYYAPQGQDPYAGLQGYLELVTEEDDEVFAEKALACIDMENLVPYLLLMQGGAICDNFFNNMYIWAHPTEDGVIYRFAPWDLDMSWGFERSQVGEEFENWLWFPVADRMINLDVGGIRQKIYDEWQHMRRTIFDRDNLEARIAEYAHQVSESGAMLRETQLRGEGDPYPDGYELLAFADMRWPLLDRAIELIATNGGEPVEFLTASHYGGQKGGTMRTALGE